MKHSIFDVPCAVLPLGLVLLAMLGLAADASAASYVERASVDGAGVEGNDHSLESAASADGSVIAFNSSASNLVAGDTNEVSDVFVRNRTTGQTRRVSVSSSGTEGNAASGGPHEGGNYTSEPAISGDGKIVVFHSRASNLVAGDTNSLIDVFAHDLTTGKTTRVNVSSAGDQATVTNPGSYPGRGVSVEPSITADGAVVAFRSEAGNLVENDTNGTMSGGEDIFTHNRATGATTRVSPSESISSEGYFSGSARSPQISADGGVVVFSSNVDVHAVDLASGQLSRVSKNSAGTGGGNGGSFFPAVSGDGRYVSFISIATDLVADDTNGKRDIFVRDRVSEVTTRANVSSLGEQANGDSFNPPGITSAGDKVVFLSQASNLVVGISGENIYTHEPRSGQTTHVAQGSEPAISADGRIVAFRSSSPLVPDDTNGRSDVFFAGSSAPTAVNDSKTVAEDSAATPLDVLANDGDPDGGTKVIASATQPTNGTVVLAGDGTSLSYRPNADYCNDPGTAPTDDFSYTLNGGSSATVAVTVTCAANVGGGANPQQLVNPQLPVTPQGPRGGTVPRCGSLRATIVAVRGSARVLGTPGPDVIVGSNRRDRIDGGGGNDVICANGGHDRVAGGSGNDLISGGPGGDRLIGGGGNDLMFGDTGRDRISGLNGNDRLNGGRGTDRIDGGAGHDLLDERGNGFERGGSLGRDTLLGGRGADRIITGGGALDGVDCGPGRDRATVDRLDRVRRCERVVGLGR